MKFKYNVLNENNSDNFDIGHCRTKVKVTARLLYSHTVIAKDTNVISYTVRYGLGFPVIDYIRSHVSPTGKVVCLSSRRSEVRA